MKLMIVDDDRQIREGIRYGIDWEKIGIYQVKDYPNGKAACQDMKVFAPDIILADIRMPVMDGLEFLKRVREWDTNIRFIILSAYSDFNYAREAIQYGANGYELKPVKMDHLIQLVQREIEEIRKIRTLRTPEEEMMDFLENPDSTKDIQGIFRRLWKQKNTAEQSNRILVFRARLEYEEEAKEDAGAAQEGIKEIVEYFGGVLLSGQKRRNIYTGFCSCSTSLFQIYQQKTEIKNRIRRLNSEMNEKKIWITVGISGYCTCGQIYQAYQQAEEVLKQCFYTGRGSVNFFDLQMKTEDLEPAWREAFLGQFQEAMEGLEWEKIRSAVLRLTEYAAKKRIEVWALREFFMQVVYDVTKDMDEYLSIEKMRNTWEQAQYIQEYGRAFEDYLKEVLEAKLKQKSRKHFSLIVVEMMKYLEQNYAGPVSLDKLSEELGKSPNYLSSVFKRETGISFTDYLLQIRMREARKLLRNTSLPVKNVAEQVGYGDYVYFAKLFKKTFGYSARSYREGRYEE